MPRAKIALGLCLMLLTGLAAQSAYAQNGRRLRVWRERAEAKREANANAREGQTERPRNGRSAVEMGRATEGHASGRAAAIHGE